MGAAESIGAAGRSSRPGMLAAFPAIPALSVGAWLHPTTREMWDAVDLAVFRALNGTLDRPPWWQVTWAVANHRAFDVVPFVITIALMLRHTFGDGARHAVSRGAAIAAAVLAMLIGRKLGTMPMRPIERESPSLVVDGAVRLSEVVPWIDAKDSSGHSFPGDHCLFLIMLTIFFWVSAGRRTGLVFVGITLVFSLPRLVCGAHWLSDDLVGSVAIALPAMGLYLGTPLHGALTRRLEPLAALVLGRWTRSARAAP